MESMRKVAKHPAVKLGAAALLVCLAVFLLRGDCIAFFTWWMLAVLLGFVFMPVTGRLFAGFADHGWMFSKMIGISVTGFLTWFLVSLKILKFTTFSCVLVTVVCGLGCVFLYLRQNRKGISVYPWSEGNLVFWQEFLFFAVFLLWVYIAGFRPETCNTTEKFMDYGFMQAMMRSEVLPPKDIWYSEGTINYYYGGQYFAVFLSRLTGTTPAITYNLSRMLVAAFAFSLPFSLVYQLFSDKQKASGKKERKPLNSLAGAAAGLGVSMGGNLHYMVYGVVLPLIQKWKGEDPSSYWFPDATRYIGHNPQVPTDQTIHEFPCYSFVLGDLHAHVVNIMFVLLLLGLLYAWMKQVVGEKERYREMGLGESVKTGLLQPQILLAAWLLGIYHWTNFWDFVIYFVVTGGVVLFANIILFRGRAKQVLLVTACQAAEAVLLCTVVILPFSLQFSSMVSGVALAQNHSRLYQLLVLWGFPGAMVLLFLASLLWKQGKKKVYVWMEELHLPDLFVLILGLCAMGLVLIPEIVYVRDIYEATSARANTMFKLTYQAFIMFGICVGYLLLRMLTQSRRFLMKTAGAAGAVCFLCCMAYFGEAVDSWYGNIFLRDNYRGLNTSAFLETEHVEDAAGIRWLEENVKGQPVTLEANGESYSGYCRVSAMTGLPTVIGWRVHEWLWRSDPVDVDAKGADVQTIYTSQDPEEVKELLEKYHVSFVFIGAKEREKYGDALNTELLKSMGVVVFQDPNYLTCIVQIT